MNRNSLVQHCTQAVPNLGIFEAMKGRKGLLLNGNATLTLTTKVSNRTRILSRAAFLFYQLLPRIIWLDAIRTTGTYLNIA
jgi:hypothetical protein